MQQLIHRTLRLIFRQSARTAIPLIRVGSLPNTAIMMQNRSLSIQENITGNGVAAPIAIKTLQIISNLPALIAMSITNRT
jgi:hypothetical protein